MLPVLKRGEGGWSRRRFRLGDNHPFSTSPWPPRRPAKDEAERALRKWLQALTPVAEHDETILQEDCSRLRAAEIGEERGRQRPGIFRQRCGINDRRMCRVREGPGDTDPRFGQSVGRVDDLNGVSARAT